MYEKQNNKNIPEKKCNYNSENNIKQKLIEEQNYFDNLFKTIDPNIKLDENQRRIILNEEKYLMVIAGAGAGKTTTISAKVDYLIKKKNMKDEEILVISFTNKAVLELNQRINKDMNHKVEIKTFHKLGYKIIKKNNNNPPKIMKEDIIKEIIDNRIINNKKKLNKILKQSSISIKKDYSKFINLCKEYITLLKAKGYKKEDIKKITYKRARERKLKEIMDGIYLEYEQKLKEKNYIDFDDMINYAKEIIKTKERVKGLEYKYIIIDEYQDISESRFMLIKEIINKTNANLMVVGDDWQCIYGFAASNINLFTKFEKYIGYFTMLKITETYRNSQELIDIAGKFIQKNNNQIKKQLKSRKRIENPITLLKYKKQEEKKKIKEALNYIIKKYGVEKNILILGRYNFDINRIIDEDITINDNNTQCPDILYKKYNSVKIKYMTIHSAKGLGYDNVILVNMENKKLGFPSKIKTEKILRPLITYDKTIKYSEERRLFYVALTRTKNENIILTPTHKPSIFIRELKKNKNIRIKTKI